MMHAKCFKNQSKMNRSMPPPREQDFIIDQELKVQISSLAQQFKRSPEWILKHALEDFYEGNSLFIRLFDYGLHAAQTGDFVNPTFLHKIIGEDISIANVPWLFWTKYMCSDLEQTLTQIVRDQPGQAESFRQNLGDVLNGYAHYNYLDMEGRIKGTRELKVPSFPYVFVSQETDNKTVFLRFLCDPSWMSRRFHLNFETPAISGTTAEIIARKLQLKHDAWMQDWPIEVADASRLEEFVAFAESETEEEAFLAVATLILESLNDAFSSEIAPSPQLLERAEALVIRVPSIMGYWLCLDTEEDDDIFQVRTYARL